MKGATIEELYDFMSNEISWRRKELDDIRGLLEANSKYDSKKKALLRAGITMLYAHWEGYIKNISKAYINFVAMRKFKYNELSGNFLALALRQRISMVNSDNIESLIDILGFLQNEMHVRSQGLSKEEVNTKSNLNSDVLKNIVASLGLDYKFFASKSNLIDVKLLAKRNSIAHGRDVLIELDDYMELMDNVLVMMGELRNQIDNAVQLKFYKKNTV